VQSNIGFSSSLVVNTAVMDIYLNYTRKHLPSCSMKRMSGYARYNSVSRNSSGGDGRREVGNGADGISLTNYTWERYYVYVRWFLLWLG